MENSINKLGLLGLNKSQAMVYLALTANGELRVQEIVAITKIPRSSVYECVRALSKLGLAEEIIEDSFKIVRAYPVSSIKHFFNEQMANLENLSEVADELEEKFTKLNSGTKGSATSVRYYKGVAGARQLFWNTLKAKNTVYVYSAWGRSSFVGKSFYKDFVKESGLRDINEKVLINPLPRVLDDLKVDQPSELARTKVDDIRALNLSEVNIQGETFIYNNIYAQVYLNADEINGFEIENPSFCNSQRSIFETLWRLAKPVSKLI